MDMIVISFCIYNRLFGADDYLKETASEF